MKLVIESFAQVNENGTKIAGLALTPRISRNNNFYFPSQLERADGKVVPLRWEHGGASTDIGEAIFHYDKEKMQLNYEAVITNKEAALQVRNRKLFVSIGAQVGDATEKICDSQKQCYSAPQELAFEELSIVEVAGIPESTVTIIESCGARICTKEEDCKCESKENQETSDDITSINAITENSSMTLEQKKDVVEESTTTTTTVKKEEDTPVVQPEAKATEVECPAGQKDDGNGKCIPEATPQECGCKNENKELPKEEKATFDADSFKNEMASLVKSTVETAVTELAKVQKTEENYRIAQISPENGSFTNDDLHKLAREGLNALNRSGYFSFEVSQDVASLRTASSNVTEAFSFASGQSGIDVMQGVDIAPAGETGLNILPFVRFKEISAGNDTAKWLKGDTPASASITEGSAVSATTHTVTPVTVTADTVTGWTQSVKYADIEDTPADLFAYLTQSAKVRYLDDIATGVLDTTASAATPLKWIRGDTQVVVTDDDIDAVVFDYKSIAYAREQLVDRGFSADQLVAFLHPRQYRELVTDSDISELVQIGDASIGKSGKIERLFGVQLVETNAVKNETAQTNTHYQAVVCVKNYTFCVGSKRKMKVEISSDADEFAKKVGFSHRTGYATYDANSIVRISSSSD